MIVNISEIINFTFVATPRKGLEKEEREKVATGLKNKNVSKTNCIRRKKTNKILVINCKRGGQFR